MAGSRDSMSGLSSSGIVRLIKKRKREDTEEKNSVENYDGAVREEKRTPLTLSALPTDLLMLTASMLDVKSFIQLSVSSKVMQQEMHHVDYWQKKLSALGYNEKALNKVLTKAKINDFPRWYRALSVFPVSSRAEVKAWELYCLTGEVTAIEYAIKRYKLHVNTTKGVYQYTMLHLAALSGADQAMRHLVQRYNIPKKAIAVNGDNVLHCAARHGAMQCAIYAIDVLSIDPITTNRDGNNAMHLAALGASVDLMRYLVKRFEILRYSQNRFGGNMLLCAAQGGSVSGIKCAITEFKLSPNSKTYLGANVLYFAAQSHSVATLSYVVNELNIAIDSKSSLRKTVLHYAAASGSAEMVHCVRQLARNAGVTLAPEAQDSLGKDAFFYANLSSNAIKVKQALEVEITPSGQKKIIKNG